MKESLPFSFITFLRTSYLYRQVYIGNPLFCGVFFPPKYFFIDSPLFIYLYTVLPFVIFILVSYFLLFIFYLTGLISFSSYMFCNVCSSSSFIFISNLPFSLPSCYPQAMQMTALYSMSSPLIFQ